MSKIYESASLEQMRDKITRFLFQKTKKLSDDGNTK
jgi:hypothetical protein